MEWTMFFMFVALKVPLLALCWLVWWAIHQTDDTSGGSNDDGGTKRRPHRPGPLPRAPRRGPHGDPAPQSPPRVRTPAARGRSVTERDSPER
jgi:hypothetical protein